MNPNTKTLLIRSAAVLGLVVVAGGAYFLTSTNNGFQASLLAQAPTEALPLVNANQNAVVTTNSNVASTGIQAVSSIFDATPTADMAAAAVVIGSGNTMSGSVMSGTVMANTNTVDDVTALENLRPAAAQQADNLLGALGFAANTNTNEPAQIANAVTTTNTDALPSATSAATNTNTSNANQNAASAALATLPRVPQTGAETWLLTASIVCAMMGMTLLLSAPKHV